MGITWWTPPCLQAEPSLSSWLIGTRPCWAEQFSKAIHPQVWMSSLYPAICNIFKAFRYQPSISSELFILLDEYLELWYLFYLCLLLYGLWPETLLKKVKLASVATRSSLCADQRGRGALPMLHILCAQTPWCAQPFLWQPFGGWSRIYMNWSKWNCSWRAIEFLMYFPSPDMLILLNLLDRPLSW